MALVMSRMQAKVAYAVLYVVACNSIDSELHSRVFILSAWDECAF